MPDGTDLFEEAFGHEDAILEEEAELSESKTKKTTNTVQARTGPAAKPGIVSSTRSDLIPLKQKPAAKRHPRQKKASVPKAAPVIESAEHRDAIKKMVLQKAKQAADEEPEDAEDAKEDGEAEEIADDSDTDSDGAGAKREKNTGVQADEKSDDDFLEHMNEDDWMREEGIQEEGTKSTAVQGTPLAGDPKIARIVSATPSDVALKFLEDDQKRIAFIGRKKSVFKQYGDTAALFVGRVEEPNDPQNEKHIYLDSLNPHVVFVCGARGSGKCLTGDTLITLEDGSVIPIQDLETRTGKILGLEHDLKMRPLHREGFYRRMVDKILQVRLRSGKTIKLTPEHPLLTVEGWKPAESLETGNRIATPRKLPVFGSFSPRECEVKLLAYLIAEGHLANQFVIFSNMDPAIVTEFYESTSEFAPNLRITQHSKPGCYRVAQKKRIVDWSHTVRNEAGQFTSDGFIVTQKNAMTNWLITLGVYDKRSVEKYIPDAFLQLGKEKLALFLNRLFSCDGSIYRVNNRKKNWCISYTSSSPKLIQQVQHLLLRFGILSTLREKTVKTNGKLFDVFELVVYGENVLKFASEIGFFGQKTIRQEQALAEMTGLARNPNTDTVPREVWNQFEVPNWAETGRKIGYSSPKSLIHSKNYAPSREKLLRLAMVEENKGIQLLAQSDIFWDEITGIQEINEPTEVFDISVPTYHNFVANDIIVHNSYVLGVIAEELALKNKDVGAIVVDPIGVFWSMRFPNKEEKEVQSLGSWGLMPRGLDNLKVFIPRGIVSQVPKSTFDGTFAIQPSLLTVEDWCLTFNIERFSPTGLLMEKGLSKVQGGFADEEGKKIKAKGSAYGLDDLIYCLEKDSELNSRERGYKQDSIRALVSRFEAAKNWGIFDQKGTPLGELSRQNQLTVLDTSFLEDNVTALVIGVLARRILAARKISARKEAAKRLKTVSMDELLELDIPPTWLFIDEAHTLIPSGNVSTPATSALVEYVKQGRRPGCSLVFATQQPSAIDSRVLSQLDVLITHKLVFDDDIKAVYKRAPTIITPRYKNANFIKTLPVGVGLTADRREETSRAFVMAIRPRMSQHEGRDAETAQQGESLAVEQVESLASEMLYGKLSVEGEVDLDKAKMVVDTLNLKYKSSAKMDKILELLRKKKVVITEDSLVLPGVKKSDEEDQRAPDGTGEKESDGSNEDTAQRVSLAEMKGKKQKKSKGIGTEESMDSEGISTDATELVSFPMRVNEQKARAIASGKAKGGLLGLFGKKEDVSSVVLKHEPIYRVRFEVPKNNAWISRECFVSAVSGEFVHFGGNHFEESKGVSKLFDLDESEIRMVTALVGKRRGLTELAKLSELDEDTSRKAVKKLVAAGLVDVSDKGSSLVYLLAKGVELPPSPLHPKLDSLSKVPFERIDTLAAIEEKVRAKDASELVGKLFADARVRGVETVYRPVYEAMLARENERRMIRIDGYNGKII
ncbi:MAG: DUF853 family protein [Candidatus Diapherotrites archaeon]|nr:DUF853 family protein [Candidatus Diapherotrites archaeon]